MAFFEKTTVSSNLQFSIVKSAVIIFVMLAGYIFLLHFLSYKIVPVDASINIADSPCKVGALGQLVLVFLGAAETSAIPNPVLESVIGIKIFPSTSIIISNADKTFLNLYVIIVISKI